MLTRLSYPGGKNGAGTYQKLINLMPPHEVYIEPFLGGGAIMRLKRAARLSVGVDLDPAPIKAAIPPGRGGFQC
jgi:DNA adenine methylase